MNDVKAGTHKKRTIGLIAIAFVIMEAIGCFLPFMRISVLGYSESVRWIDGAGVLAIISLVIAVVMILIRKKATYIVAILFEIINVILVVRDALISIGEYKSMVSFEVGAYIVIPASVIILITTIVALIKE